MEELTLPGLVSLPLIMEKSCFPKQEAGNIYCPVVPVLAYLAKFLITLSFLTKSAMPIGLMLKVEVPMAQVRVSGERRQHYSGDIAFSCS